MVSHSPASHSHSTPADKTSDSASANTSKHQHQHQHGHGHHHHHHGNPGTTSTSAFVLASLGYAVIIGMQGVYGWLANSTALLADAGHNLSDMLGLLLAWGAVWLSKKRPSTAYTFGLRSSSILASLANAVLLLLASGAIVWEAIQRLRHPMPVTGTLVFAVAITGMIINSFSAWLFMKGSKHDLNLRGAFLHMISDAAISAAVAIGGLVVWATGWHWLDPTLAIIVVLVIIYGSWGLLRDAIRLSLNAVPANIDTQRIETYLASLPGVESVHDLHVWGLSTTESSMTVHLVTPNGHPGDDFLDQVVHTLNHDHGVHHATIQIDLGTSTHSCALH